MRIRFGLHLVLLAGALTSVATAADDDSKGHAYVFVAPGGFTAVGHTSSFLHLGAGGEGFVRRGFALGGEIGVAGPTSSFGDAVGIFSANGAYHFRGSERKIVPFVTGGYSLLFRSGHQSGANFGAGFTWWASEHHGLRFEVRDHIFPETGATGNLYGVRIGWSFR